MSMPRLEALQARIRNDDYAVDTQAVAEAILSRLFGPGRGPADDDVRFGFGGGPATA